MKKKILALICSVVVVLGNMGVYAEYTDMPENTNETRIVNILTKMGIMNGYEDGSFKPSKAITRSEFVTLLYKSISSLNSSAEGGGDDSTDGFNWRKFFLGQDSDDLKLLYPPEMIQEDGTEPVSKALWNDVSEDYWAYSYLKTMKERGIISGYEDNSFKPENVVTYNEAVKIILSVCGYSQYANTIGGYPQGYLKIATENNLQNGVTAAGDSPMSRMDAATLIYNSFKIEIMPTVYQGENEHRNFLNDIVGIYTLEGTVISTDITSVYGERPMPEKTAKIGDVYFTFDDDTVAVRDCIGEDIRVFLKKNADDEYSLITFERTNRDNITVIENKCLEEYSDNAFTYRINEDSNVKKRVIIRNGSVVIYNGKYLEGYNEDTFRNLGNGTVRVIKKSKLDFDIVAVENYITGYTQSIDKKRKEIADALAAENAIIYCDKNIGNESIISNILDADGKSIQFENIGEGAINYYSNGDYLKLYYTTAGINGKISNIYESDGKHYIEIGNTEYKLSDSYYKYTGSSIMKNIDVSVSLDIFGEVVWISNSDVPLEGYAYLIKSTKDDFGEALLLTYYDFDTNAVVQNVSTNSSVRFVNQKGESIKANSDGLAEILSDYDGVIKIIKDEDGLIKKIELPKNSDSDDPNALKLILESNNQTSSENYKGKLSYNNWSNAFGGKKYINSNTKILNVPVDKNDLSYYKTTNSLEAGDYLFKLYSFDAESPYTKIAIVYKEKTMTYFDTLHGSVNTYFVMNRQETLNSDDEVGVKLTLYDGSSTQEFFAVNEDDGKSAFDKAMNAVDEDAGMKVSPGDFVQLAIDQVDGTVVMARILFDADGINPAWCGADPAEQATSCPPGHTHTVETLGTIPGTTGFAYSSSNKTNPLGYTGTGISGYERIPGSRNCHQMFMYGYVYSMKEGLMEITSENLAQGFSGTPNSADYSYCFYNPDQVPATYVIIHNTRNGYVLEKGTINDIRTYKQVGSKCTRAFFDLSGGSMRRLWIFAED